VAVVFCTCQSAPQTPTSGPAGSAQSPAPSVATHDKPSTQPSALNSHGQDSVVQDPKENRDPKKNDRMFYVMPNYLTVDNQS